MASSPPEHFLCPISLAVMKMPVRDKRTGHTFERSAILQWIYFHHGEGGNATCPLTRKPLETKHLCLDLDLQREITAWKRIRAMSDCSSSSSSSEQEGTPRRHIQDEVLLDLDCGWGSSPEESMLAPSKSQNDFFQDKDRMARLQGVCNRVLRERQKHIQEHLLATRSS